MPIDQGCRPARCRAPGFRHIDECVRKAFLAQQIGHAIGDVLRKLERYRHRIGHVQVAAVPSRAEPDEGEICYRAIFEQLDSMGYASFVGYEYG